MQGTKIILGTYNTMPDGASGKVYELAYQRSWRPFLSSLYKFQTVSAVLYYSGIVLRWIEDNHPEFILLLEEMAGRKQIELLGGGFFNPLFPALQPSDKIGQIEMLTTHLRKTFGRRPSGGWLYEYSWDSNLPVIFRTSGLSYSFLPSTVLNDAGIAESGDTAPLLTEDQRKLLYVFPVFDLDESFEEALPFESALERLMDRHPGAKLYTMMADGHSVPGMWEASGLESPDVMFEKTFAWFQKNCLDLETVTAQGYARNLKGGRLFYLASCASSRLKAGLQGAVVSARHCAPLLARQIILQNPCHKRLYDRMYYTHSLMALLRGDKARKKSAQEDLWRAQNGDVYWDSGVGGLRRPEVRLSAYRALLEAEKATRQPGLFNPGILVDDIDCDGEKEIVYQAADMNCYLHARGASVFEIDSFRHKKNYSCVYETGAACAANSFVDRIFAAGSFKNEWSNLGSLGYTLFDREKSSSRVSFGREFILKAEKSHHPFAIKKTFLFQKGCISLDVELINRSQQQVELRYVSEANLQPAAALEDTEWYASQDREKKAIPLTEEPFSCAAEALYIQPRQGKEALEIRSDRAFQLLMSHRLDRLDSLQLRRLYGGSKEVESPACGGDIFYQGTRLFFGWDVVLPADSSAVFSLSLHL